MEDYHHLHKEILRLKECKNQQKKHKEILIQNTGQLLHRRKQMISQLLQLYPIECVEGKKYYINGVHLPNSDYLHGIFIFENVSYISFSDVIECPSNDVQIALGYVAHLLTMCASFLQVPLRYPIVHFGSRSTIIDHITPTVPNTKRE